MTDPNETIDHLTARLARLEATEDIRRLIRAYGYFIDKACYAEALGCFTANGAIVYLNGVFRGRNHGLARLHETFLRRNPAGRTPPLRGLLIDHPMLQDIVEIAADGRSARARARLLELSGVHDGNDSARGDMVIPMPLEMVGVHVLKVDPDRLPPPPPAAPDEPPRARQWIGGAMLEARFVREECVWKIDRLEYRIDWNASFTAGWAYDQARTTPFERLYPDDPAGPDAFGEADRSASIVNWPVRGAPDFRFAHPVTGQPVPFG